MIMDLPNMYHRQQQNSWNYINNNRYVFLKLFFGYSILNLLMLRNTVYGCDSLVADTDLPQYIVSHDDYGTDDYESRESRCWQIFAPNASYVVKLEEVDFRLEYGGTGCLYDYLAIYNGPIVTSSSLGVYCGTSGPETVYSTQQYMTLKFTSDATFQDGGFRFRFTSIFKDDVPTSVARLSTGAIIGIVMCVVIVILIIGTVVIVCIKNKTQKVSAQVSHNRRPHYSLHHTEDMQTRHGTNRLRTVSQRCEENRIPMGQLPQPPPYEEFVHHTPRESIINNSAGNNCRQLPPVSCGGASTRGDLTDRSNGGCRGDWTSRSSNSSAFTHEATLPGYYSIPVNTYALPPDIPYPASPPPAYTPTPR